jgi:FixJ family two-component response regulator
LLVDAGTGNPEWETAMNMLSRDHPGTTLVLVSGDADEGFWIDALEKGAYDLVLKPFVGSELRRILENANAHAQTSLQTATARP